MKKESSMKFVGILALTALLSAPYIGRAEETAAPKKTSLEDQLKAMDFANQAPIGESRESLYAIQARYLPLKWKSEVTMGAATNLTPDSFLTSEQFEIGYRIHFNDSWSLGVANAWVNNRLKSEATTIQTRDGAIPEVPFASTRTDLMLEYNVFYGKFRWSTTSVSYFDVYVAGGPGVVRQNTGTVGAGVADLGFVFWVSQWGSVRMGLKDYYYNETFRSDTSPSSNLHAHLDLGYLF
jgi:outer membrane beta-barrel protein